MSSNSKIGVFFFKDLVFGFESSEKPFWSIPSSPDPLHELKMTWQTPLKTVLSPKTPAGPAQSVAHCILYTSPPRSVHISTPPYTHFVCKQNSTGTFYEGWLSYHLEEKMEHLKLNFIEKYLKQD